MSVLVYGTTTRTLTKYLEKKLDENYIRMLSCCFEQLLEAAPYKTVAVQPSK